MGIRKANIDNFLWEIICENYCVLCKRLMSEINKILFLLYNSIGHWMIAQICFFMVVRINLFFVGLVIKNAFKRDQRSSFGCRVMGTHENVCSVYKVIRSLSKYLKCYGNIFDRFILEETDRRGWSQSCDKNVWKHSFSVTWFKFRIERRRISCKTNWNAQICIWKFK